jgi:hypothetical protein
MHENTKGTNNKIFVSFVLLWLGVDFKNALIEIQIEKT